MHKQMFQDVLVWNTAMLTSRGQVNMLSQQEPSNRWLPCVFALDYE